MGGVILVSTRSEIIYEYLESYPADFPAVQGNARVQPSPRRMIHFLHLLELLDACSALAPETLGQEIKTSFIRIGDNFTQIS